MYNLRWLKQTIYDPRCKGDRDIDVIQFDSTDNPAFSKAEAERLRSRMPIWKFNMHYRGRFERPAGLIYDSFNEDLCFCVGGSKSEDQWRLEFRRGGLPVNPPDISEVEIGIDRVYGAHKRNEIIPHHPQYWQGAVMPPTYVREMVADWIGAGLAQGTPFVREWYDKNKHRQELHADARQLATQLLEELHAKGHIP